VTDPAYAKDDPANYLTGDVLAKMAQRVNPVVALPWPAPAPGGDTVWLGVIDGQGRAVSLIQSIYWEFGSGVVLQDTGVLWQNRGMSFSLSESALNALCPGRKPFHTLNPAMARLADGRLMVYGTMAARGSPRPRRPCSPDTSSTARNCRPP